MTTAPTCELSIVNHHQPPAHQRHCTQPHFKERKRHPHAHLQRWHGSHSTSSNHIHSILFDDVNSASSDQIDTDEQQQQQQADSAAFPRSSSPYAFLFPRRRVIVRTNNQCLAGQQGLESRF
jgi:hypothetical protein